MRAKATMLSVCFAVCAYYFWAATRYNELSPNGYYNYLAREWEAGHLYVPIAVDPRLLTQPNPYDPNLPDEIKVHDMVLFEGHYFLYHGPAAALFTFYPYRRLTGKDLPVPIAVVFFVALAFLANAFTLNRLNPQAGPLLYAVLGLANGIPFLLHRIWVYEVAIACGQATLSIAIALQAAGRFRTSGLWFGMLALSRPHLLLAAIFMDRRTESTAAGLSFSFLVPSLYLFLVEIPNFIPRFPFIAIHNQPAIEFPPLFFHENMLGAFWLAPFAFLKKPIWMLAMPALLVLLFLSTTGWVTE